MIEVYKNSTLKFKNKQYKCAIGANGIKENKKEGDGTTPSGVFSLGSIFYRKDNNLTDWTFNFDSTSARFANPVDIDTAGVEFLATKHFDTAKLIASYTYLHKSENYGAADIDASFYALNFPDHRLTLGAVYNPTDILEFRIDNNVKGDVLFAPPKQVGVVITEVITDNKYKSDMREQIKQLLSLHRDSVQISAQENSRDYSEDADKIMRKMIVNTLERLKMVSRMGRQFD